MPRLQHPVILQLHVARSSGTTVEVLKRTKEQGVPAPGWLITLGWALAFTGGVFGIGHRIGFWKVERSLGEFGL